MWQVVGVGTKALAEAAQHNTFDLKTLGNWDAGKPVPFAFLADAFEAIAQVGTLKSSPSCLQLHQHSHSVYCRALHRPRLHSLIMASFAWEQLA